jgi:outer membrane lipoprotein LolB
MRAALAGAAPLAERFLRALLVMAILAGCAPVEIKPPQGPLDFDLLARIAARYGNESFSGNVAWRHAADGDEMLISTPFGQGVARIVRQGEAVLLTTAEPREYRSNDAEELTQRVLGFRVPLVGLADWIRGRPSPDLESRGWKIEIQEVDQNRRPMRMRLTYQGIELRLAVMQWN